MPCEGFQRSVVMGFNDSWKLGSDIAGWGGFGELSEELDPFEGLGGSFGGEIGEEKNLAPKGSKVND